MEKKILVIDDNDDDRIVCSTLLEFYGYQVLSAPNASEGIRLAREAQPDLILMDVIMPEMNGLTATELLKSDTATSGIPVVVLSGFDVSPQLIQESRCDRFLSKPVESPTLLYEVITIIGPGAP